MMRNSAGILWLTSASNEDAECNESNCWEKSNQERGLKWQKSGWLTIRFEPLLDLSLYI